MNDAQRSLSRRSNNADAVAAAIRKMAASLPFGHVLSLPTDCDMIHFDMTVINQ
jgi:hypothetical protein